MSRWLLTWTLPWMVVLAAGPRLARAEGEDLPGVEAEDLGVGASNEGEEPEVPAPVVAPPPSPAPATSGSPPSPSPTAEPRCPSPDGPLYPTRRVCRGEAPPLPGGFLIHPARFRELRTLVVGTLPACEQALTRCREDLEDGPGAPPGGTPEAGPSWAANLRWAGTGLAVGLAAGVLLTLAVGGG